MTGHRSLTRCPLVGWRLFSVLVALVATAIFWIPPADALAQLNLDIESGLVNSGYNDVRIPGTTGTEFSLVDDLQTNDAGFFRARLTYSLSRRSSLSALVAPLTLKASGTVDRDIRFANETFPAATPLSAEYRFDSYRLTYRYDDALSERLTFGYGFTLKIRDATIKVEGAGRNAQKDNVGLVPLLHWRLVWRYGGPWSLLFAGDALAAPQGRAEDVTLAIQVSTSRQTNLRLGYRILEGGADVDEVYTFALLHYFLLGADFSF